MRNNVEISTGQQFRVERELKRREDGRVVLVRDSQTLQRYIYREFSGSPAAYRAMLALDSPYLPRILAVEEHDGTVLVLEEYIQGDSLEDILSAGSIPQEQARQILLELCFALLLLHGVGIVHRDIKPENVILRSDHAVLIDFDISRLTDPKQSTDTQIMGTNGYAAPEQYGVCQTDQRADIYAMGVLANELLTRRHPSVTLAEGALRPIIEKCIAVNVDQRYASAAELIEALSAISPEPLPMPNRRRKQRRIAATVLCCVLASGAGLAVGRASLGWKFPAATVQEETLFQAEATATQEAAVPPTVVDGAVVDMEEYLTQRLRSYIATEDYQARCAQFTAFTGMTAPDFTVTHAIDLTADDLGPGKLSVHLLVVRAHCGYVNNGLYDTLILVIDCDTGKLYDQFSTDADYFNANSVEGQVYSVLNSILQDIFYSGGAIFGTEGETLYFLPDDALDRMNDNLTLD